MKKSDIIEVVLKSVRAKCNRMTVKELESLVDRHPWISRKKRAKK